jgi:hypothetical protein
VLKIFFKFLNFFEKTLKILKIIQVYKKYIYFWIFKNILIKYSKKSSYDMQ